MRTIIITLIFIVQVANAEPSARPPPTVVKCFQVPPEIRDAWHLKQTDCLHEVSVVKACDVTPPDIAKQLGLKLQCPNWPRPKK